MSIDYSKGICFADTRGDDQGEPLSVRKLFHLAEACNNLLGRRNATWSDVFDADRTQTGGVLKLVYGPIRLPYYASINGTTRSLYVKAYMKTDANTGIATFSAASTPIRGATATTGVVQSLFENSTSVSTTSTTFVWTSESAITVPGLVPGAPATFWLTVFASTNNAGATASIRGISVREAGL